MTVVFHTPQELQTWRKQQSRSIGFVPTMGALHEGHATLIRQARNENDLCVLSVFVNPTQFNDPKDFEKYPITWEKDLALAKSLGVDVVFAPTRELMYPDGYLYKLSESEFSKELCGKDRPGHFDGVLTVVMKLFQVVQPTKAYFGEKDFQQLSLIQGMVKAFFLPLEIVPVPTVREQDGLAMSSRNVRLSSQQRAQVPLIHRLLVSSASVVDVRRSLEEQGWHVDYIVDYKNRRFVAVKVGDVRLIDNVEI